MLAKLRQYLVRFGFLSSSSTIVPAVVALISILLYFALGHERQYVFSPEFLRETATKALKENGDNLNGTMGQIIEDLRGEYGEHIIAEPRWVFNNAGGAMGAMLVLHFSLTEYVIIFGTPVGTEGHSGRFLADDYFMLLAGEQWAFAPGSLQREVYRPGDLHLMPHGVAKQYRCPEACWALEYARGNMLSMLPPLLESGALASRTALGARQSAFG